MKRWNTLLVLLATLAAGCDDPPASPAPWDDVAADAADAEDTSDVEDAGPSASHVLAQRYAGLRDAVIAYLSSPNRIKDGDWVSDYGDAPMYGPSFDLRWWHLTGAEAHLDRGIAALEHDLTLIEGVIEDPITITADMEQVAMATLGLIEAGLYVDDDRYLTAATQVLELIDTLSESFDDYIDVSVGRFAANTYGPTAISAFVALIHLEHALVYPQLDRAGHIARAEEVLGRIHARAWDDQLGAYRFEPDDDGLYLYPSVTNMLGWARAYELTGDPDHLARAEAAWAGIQPLRADSGFFKSPYSATYMGAATDDYATLSSQNYLMLALVVMAQATGDAGWLDDVDGVLAFLEDKLLLEGQILHHWIDGRPAWPSDPEYYCSGCNLQTLYVLSLMADD